MRSHACSSKRTSSRPVSAGRFSVLELTFALALLLLLATGFAGLLEVVVRQQRQFTDENRALLVLDNTLERLAARPSRTFADARAVFLDEFEASGLSRNPAVTPACEQSRDRLVLAVVKTNRRTLARVEFTCASK